MDTDEGVISLGESGAPSIGVEDARHFKVAIVGARGYVGEELIRLIDHHPALDLSVVSSRELAGQAVSERISGIGTDLRYEALEPSQVADRDADLWILALPNGQSAPWVEALSARGADVRILDLSTDHRLDPGWVYGLPERYRPELHQATRISNPGCYATGMHLGLWPILECIEGTPHCFGVSGYSGAGTAPSRKNDPAVLKDNLLPYDLASHFHATEVGHRLGRRIAFLPHVAPFFRGITLTLSFDLRYEETHDSIAARLRDAYGREPLVRVVEAAPLVRDIAGKPHLEIGGVAVDKDGKRGALVVTLDNLLKGAAVQAVQNLNLSCGFHETLGLEP